MIKVLYTGSFDPITKGHMNIIEQASYLFDEVIIAILHNPLKQNPFFRIEERLEMLTLLYENIANVKVIASENSAIDTAIENGCGAIIRGARSGADFDYEMQLSQINLDISDDKIKSICLFADYRYRHVSSTMVKELFRLDKDIDKYVDPTIKERMLIKRRRAND